jgi:molybdate transport system regulatory protein
MKRIRWGAKVWLEIDGKPLLGEGGAEILEEIDRSGSISEAARSLGMSYYFVWSYLKRMEERLGKTIIETYKGGKEGGGAWLTETGRRLLDEYKRLRDRIEALLSEAELPTLNPRLG